MLGIKLVDVDTSNAREEQTGTCELCFGSAWCDNPILIFENPKGERAEIDGYCWIWGDYLELEIDNYLNFSDWLSKQDINWDTLKGGGYGHLADLVNWYSEEKCKRGGRMIPKFRAWDVHEKKMFTNDQLIIWNGNVYANDNSKLNVDNLKGWNIDEKYLMQSTGLFDKNGKEIFEGDIVKYKAGCNTFTEEVAYDKNFAGFGVMNYYADIIFTFGELFKDICISSLEVVGNIWEDGELLDS